jgi:HEAT repeat protein
MSKTALATGFVIVVALTGVVLAFVSGSRGLGSPDALAERALNAATVEERQRAALDLGRIGPSGQEALRRVLAESKTPEVKAAAIQGLLDQQDYSSLPVFLALLDDPSPLVRGRAGVAVTQLLGRNFQFLAEDPPARRAEAVEKMKRAYKEMPKPSPP